VKPPFEVWLNESSLKLPITILDEALKTAVKQHHPNGFWVNRL